MRYLYLFILTICTSFTAQAQNYTFTELDLFPDSIGAGPYHFATLNGKMYLSALSHNGYNDRELWVSDGTLAGSKPVKKSLPGARYSDVHNLAVFNGYIYFGASDSLHGAELWISDGTDTGTHIFKEILPGVLWGYISDFITCNGKLYFTVWNKEKELWVTDGTVAGTTKLYTNYGANLAPLNFIEYSGKLYFAGSDSTHGMEVWVSDGTVSGTAMVKDIYPGTGWGGFFRPVVFNGKLYFVAENGALNYELWTSDGTAADTKSFSAGGGFNARGALGVFNNKLYFIGEQSTTGGELWSTDGTLTGTSMITEIYPGPLHSVWGNTEFYVLNNKMYFVAQDDSGGMELWRSDGSAAGTSRVADINAGKENSWPLGFTEYHGKLYFCAIDSVSGDYQFYRTDGSDTGTNKLMPSNAVSSFTDPLHSSIHFEANIHIFDNTLFLGAEYTYHGYELWAFRDTAPGTSRIALKDNDDNFVVYPNPNHGNFTVKSSAYDAAEDNMLTVSDITGRVVHSEKVQAAVTHVRSRGLTAGVYLLQLQQGDKRSVQKLVVE